MRGRRFAACAATVALAAAGCGGEDEPTDRDIGLEGPSPSYTAPSTPSPVPTDLPTMDGYLRSADERRVVLLAEGDRKVFLVDPADLRKIGIEHLASHAGLTDIGFRVYYDEVGGRRYVKFAQEIPPPAATR